MEVIEEDIRDNRSASIVKQFKDCILDTAKNIKSNDEVFSVCSLPEVREKLTKCMSDYVDNIRRVDASHKAFSVLKDDVDITNEEELDAFEDQYNAISEGEMNQQHPEHTALDSLFAIITLPQPRDEEVVVEAPSQRQWPKDPYTKTNIKKAVKNKICNHTYDKTSIDQYLSGASNKKQRPCPFAGCTNKKVENKDLVPDDEANALIESLKSESSSQ